MSNVQELPRRNAESVMQTLRAMDIKLAEMHQRIDGLNSQVATLISRLAVAENNLAILRIAKMGTGPTRV